MSEKIEPMLDIMNSLPSLSTEYKKTCDEDTQILELINHLNDINNRNEHGSLGSKAETETQSDGTTDPIDDYDDDEEDNNLNESSHIKPSKIPSLAPSSIVLKTTTNTSTLMTKIPRISNKIPVRQSTNLTSLPIDLTSSSVSSLSQAEDEKPNTNRIPRYFLRTSSGLNNSNCQDDKTDVLNKAIIKRGQSAVASSKSSFRSFSITSDTNSLLGDQSFTTDGVKKNVKYIMRHKPRESQVVKIFSQKLVLKNVSSKIGSLEKAAYVPGGGAVVIESQKLNWNAQAKIGSLDKAAYTPGGGNKRIETQKLNWNAQAKIGSLEKANYTPGGGHVKIENRKLNFKENARPKTDTGLMMVEMIETSSPNSYLSHSLSVSTEQIQSF